MIDNFTDEIFSDPFFAQEREFESKNGTKATLTCIVQPASSDDIQLLPEGERYNPVVRVMTQVPVENNALFYWNNIRWRLVSDALWSDYGYYDTLATRYEGSQTNDLGAFRVT